MRVALTGGMCSGKSAAASLFSARGCFVSQSDEVARSMMQPEGPLFPPIVRAFGEQVVGADGTLDRSVLAKLAFGEGRVEQLNAIVHPAVIAQQNAWMQSVEEAQPDGIAMIESALVMETRYGPAGTTTADPSAPWRTRFDRILVVTAPDALRFERYFARVHASTPEERRIAEIDARARMALQMPQAEKAALADAVICNDGTWQDLEAAVDRVWHQLQQAVADAAAEAM